MQDFVIISQLFPTENNFKFLKDAETLPPLVDAEKNHFLCPKFFDENFNSSVITLKVRWAVKKAPLLSIRHSLLHEHALNYQNESILGSFRRLFRDKRFSPKQQLYEKCLPFYFSS